MVFLLYRGVRQKRKSHQLGLLIGSAREHKQDFAGELHPRAPTKNMSRTFSRNVAFVAEDGSKNLLIAGDWSELIGQQDVRRWVTLQDAATITGIPEQTLYAAVYRGGRGRRPTFPRRYIKENENQHRGTLCIPLKEAIEYRVSEIVKDSERCEAELKATLQQWGITDAEYHEIVGRYQKAFERVIREARAKELEGVVINESVAV